MKVAIAMMAVVSNWWVFALDLNCLANRSIYFGLLPQDENLSTTFPDRFTHEQDFLTAIACRVGDAKLVL